MIIAGVKDIPLVLAKEKQRKQKMKKKSKKRGRPKGARNKYTAGIPCTHLTELVLTCKNCGRVMNVTTHKKNIGEVYTKEVIKNWKCGLC